MIAELHCHCSRGCIKAACASLVLLIQKLCCFMSLTDMSGERVEQSCRAVPAAHKRRLIAVGDTVPQPAQEAIVW